MSKPDWYDPQNIAGFQAFPCYQVIFLDGRLSQQITAGELIWACRQLGISVSSLIQQKLSKKEAIALYRQGKITEGLLAESLGVDRLEARRIVQETELQD